MISTTKKRFFRKSPLSYMQGVFLLLNWQAFFFFFLALTPLTGRAEIIKQIVVLGEKKTRENSLLRRAQIKVGDVLDSESLKDLKAHLSQNPQYQIKKIDFQRGILTIEIEDKWSIIPLPILTQSGDYYNRGILIYENNFLGRLETLIPAISWTNSGLNGILVYNSESLFTPELGLSSVLIKRTDLTKFHRRGDLVKIFETELKALEVTPNYFIKNIVLKAGPIYLERTVYDEVGMKTFSFTGPGIHFRYHAKYYKNLDVQYDGYFFTSNMLFIPYYRDRNYYSGNLEFHSSIPIKKSFLNILGNIGYTTDKSYLYPHFMGGDEGFRGYDALSFPLQKYLSSTLQYQQFLTEQLYFIGFLESNASTLINPVYGGKSLFENTLGAGVRYYFKKITVPGINIEAARNLQDRSTHLHLGLGIKL